MESAHENNSVGKLNAMGNASGELPMMFLIQYKQSMVVKTRDVIV